MVVNGLGWGITNSYPQEVVCERRNNGRKFEKMKDEITKKIC